MTELGAPSAVSALGQDTEVFSGHITEMVWILLNIQAGSAVHTLTPYLLVFRATLADPRER